LQNNELGKVFCRFFIAVSFVPPRSHSNPVGGQENNGVLQEKSKTLGMKWPLIGIYHSARRWPRRVPKILLNLPKARCVSLVVVRVRSKVRLPLLPP
jgi:hypothetical protein